MNAISPMSGAIQPVQPQKLQQTEQAAPPPPPPEREPRATEQVQTEQLASPVEYPSEPPVSQYSTNPQVSAYQQNLATPPMGTGLGKLFNQQA